LRKLGCVVAVAIYWDEVVHAVTSAVAAGSPFELVLMDIVMVRATTAVPYSWFRSHERRTHACTQVRVNGDTALRALRASGSVVPVAAVSTNATHDDVERFRAQGFAGALPFSPAQMHALLTHVLPRRR
jgi:CheY-like chemotaxis protein